MSEQVVKVKITNVLKLLMDQLFYQARQEFVV